MSAATPQSRRRTIEDRLPWSLPATTPRCRIVISYASEDRASARILGACLDVFRPFGVEVWADWRSLAPGVAWVATIREAIGSCDMVCALVSQATEQRPAGVFREEWDLACSRRPPLADQAFVLPLVVDAQMSRYVEVPDIFRRLQWGHAPGGLLTPPVLSLLVERLAPP